VSVFRHIKQLVSESIIYGISGTVVKSIGFFLIPIYTRIFQPAEYGIIALITTLTGLLGLFAVLGLDNSSARWFYDTDESQDRKHTISSWLWCQLSVSCIIALSLILFSTHISDFLFKSKEYAILICLAAITILFRTFSKVLSNWLRYQRRAWTTTAFSTASTLGTIGIIVLFVVVFRWGLLGIYSANLVAAIFIAITAISILRAWISPAYFSWTRLKEMLAYGLPLVPAAIASWITISSDRFILQMFHDNSEVGLYAVAATIASGVALITGAFRMAWGPFAFSIFREKESFIVYSKVFSLYALIGCLLGTTVSLFAPLLFRVLTSHEYFQSVSCIPFLAFSYILIGLTYIVGIGSGIVKRSKPIAIGIFIGATINIILNFILIPRYGKVGAAIATLLSYLCVFMYRYPISQYDYRIPYRIWHMGICFGFSWFLILIDHLFIPSTSLTAFALRAGMCLLFVPLSFLLGIIRPGHIKRLFTFFSGRIKTAMV
jgi:O-antigen/teichoic acid export membrane protein